MCLLEITSDNPDFGFVIFKNPSSGMQLKSMRKGSVYGWYNNTDRYLIYFKDGFDEISYKEHPNQSFDYLNKLRYTSPIFVLNALSEFLKSTIKQCHPKDVPSHNTFKMYAVQIDPTTYKTLTKLTNFAPEFNLVFESKACQTYEVSISTNETLYTLLNFVTVYFGLISAMNNHDFDLGEHLIERVIDATNIINAPYFVRYVINSRMIKGIKLFRKFEKQLTGPNMVLKYGNTAQQRRDLIKSLLNFDRTIVDIGCGEGSYAIPYATLLAGRTKDAIYYAIDIDEAELASLRRKASKKELTNIITMNSYTELDLEECDVILTEVIEHMEPEEATILIQWVLEHLNYHKFIITTPNFDFNKYYKIDTFRHEDHHWEMTALQFKSFIESVVHPDLTIKYLEIGDCVEGIPCSQGVLIQK